MFYFLLLLLLLLLQASKPAEGFAISASKSSSTKACSLSTKHQQVDGTIAEFETGRDVTEAVVRKIIRSQIFTEDYGFLLRLAYVESRFGKRSNTFKDGYFGGIWQVDKWMLEKTQYTENETLYPILQPIHNSIKTHFNITWRNVKWEELVKPLYSGLAARLFVAINESLCHTTIPDTINRQAEFWHDFYNFGVYGMGSKFQQESQILQDETRPCRTKLDLVVAIDGSSSVGRENFSIASKFLGSLLVKTFQQEALIHSRIGMFIFSTLPYYLFDLESDLSLGKMRSVIENANYPFGDTNAPRAMLYGTNMLKDVAQRTVPKILLLFQEGQSNVSIKEAAATVAQNNITTIVVGIGRDVNQTELIEIGLGEKMNVFNISGFGSLQDFSLRLSPILCTIAQPPLLLEDLHISDSLAFGERRYYVIEIPSDSGVTIFITMTKGETIAFWSYSDQIPSRISHDGEIDGDTFIPSYNYECDTGKESTGLPKQQRHSKTHKDGNGEKCKPFPQKAYVTIEGNSTENNIYNVYTKEGNHDSCGGSSGSFPSIHIGGDKTSAFKFLLFGLMIYRLWGVF